ncbi:MAG: apolipoprotein N-acyltransferase [Burkholderiales bacterium]|nr:apolipoprotein N-acyltransferase [Burkholderiales bacterium]
MLTRLLALVAGAACVFGFAPFAVPLVTIAALFVLFHLWSRATPREAGILGFAFGVGLFGVGVSWVYIALETFGGMPTPVAVIATAGFVAYLALWPALAGWVAARLTPPDSWARLAAAAAAFMLTEWLRGLVFTGFGWLAIGYAELPSAGAWPLAGYAPVGGVFLVTLAVCACAAAAAGVAHALAAYHARQAVAALGVIAGIAVAGALLLRVEWTQPHGAPVAISLLQGNVQQADKFRKDFLPRTYELYDELLRLSQGRIVVMPESAYPQFADEIPAAVFQRLADTARARDGLVLTGFFVAEPGSPGEGERIHNSVASFGAAPPQLYFKHHLVPFGESIPLKPLTGWFINRVLAIPLADQAPGPASQPPFEVAGQRLAVNICYEDVFGAELIPAARAATILVNVTNDAWYGRSIAARQHNQIGAMRALETGRPMLRATNTGITSAIAHDGRVISQLPWFTRGILEADVTGRTGDTLYMRVGDWLAAGLAALALVAAALIGRRRRSSPPENR